MTLATTAPALSVSDLSVAYRTTRGPVTAVRDASFEVGHGEAVALIGESGSGKSTIGLAIMGLLPSNGEITGGEIAFRADPDAPPLAVLDLSAEERRAFRWASCAMVPQGAISALNPVMRVADHFRDTAAAHGLGAGGAEATGRQLLADVRLDAERVWRAYPHELSGGMRQRVLIALALLLRPPLLILDEPTTALDILTQRSILEIIEDLRRQRRFAVVFITHDLPIAAEFCDRIVTMYAGRPVETGPVTALVDRPRHPYTAGLLAAVPTIGDGHQAGAIPGSPPDLAALPPGCAFAPRCAFAIDACREIEPALEPIGRDRAVACLRHEEVAGA